MIAYLINFTLCSAVLLLGYQLLLKNKAMHQFNRFYLLFSILFSFAIPFISIKKDAAPLPSVNPAQIEFIAAYDHKPLILPNTRFPASRPVDYSLYTRYIPFTLYLLVASLLLFRFFKNLYSIRKAILGDERTSCQQARLVLTNNCLTTHTFLHFIFLNKDDYLHGRIENEIMQHELTHVRQLHTLDILFIELVQAVCWFNPFIMFYRKDIQLNHEFIADKAVINCHPNINSYQNLLVSKLGQLRSLTITNLTIQLPKSD